MIKAISKTWKHETWQVKRSKSQDITINHERSWWQNRKHEFGKWESIQPTNEILECLGSPAAGFSTRMLSLAARGLTRQDFRFEVAKPFSVHGTDLSWRFFASCASYASWYTVGRDCSADMPLFTASHWSDGYRSNIGTGWNATKGTPSSITIKDLAAHVPCAPFKAF